MNDKELTKEQQAALEMWSLSITASQTCNRILEAAKKAYENSLKEYK